MTMMTIPGEAMLRSLLLALLVGTILRLLRVRHARVQKRAWTAVLIVALAMPALLYWHLPFLSISALWMAPPPPQIDSAPRNPMEWSLPASNHPAAATAQPAAAVPGAPEPVRRFPPRSWWLLGSFAYASICALFLFRIAAGLVLAARMWRRAEPFSIPGTSALVRLTVEIRSPVTVAQGILLPREAETWDTDTLHATLAHEAAHVREGDFYLQLAANLHLALFWPSPLAWWIRPQLARVSEIICDRAAVECSRDGLSYAQLLLRFATGRQGSSGMVAMAQSAGLRERVERLIADPQLSTHFRRRRGQAFAVALLLGASALTAAATIRIIYPELGVLALPQPTSQMQVPPAQADLPAQAAPVPSDTTDEGHSSPMGTTHPADPVPAAAPTRQAPAAATDSYAIYGPDSGGNAMTHGWYRDLEKLEQQHVQHPGGAIWFEKDGRPWVIDDPALIGEARGAFAPLEDLAARQRALREKLSPFREQQSDIAEALSDIVKKQSDLGEWQRALSDMHPKIEMPPAFNDTLKKLAEGEAKLAWPDASMSAAERATLEAQRAEAKARIEQMMADFKAQEPQREALVKKLVQENENRRHEMEPLLKEMRELGAEQAELSREQVQLGMRQSEVSAAADRKVQSLIDQAIRDGKAHPAN